MHRVGSEPGSCSEPSRSPSPSSRTAQEVGRGRSLGWAGLGRHLLLLRDTARSEGRGQGGLSGTPGSPPAPHPPAPALLGVHRCSRSPARWPTVHNYLPRACLCIRAPSQHLGVTPPIRMHTGFWPTPPLWGASLTFLGRAGQGQGLRPSPCSTVSPRSGSTLVSPGDSNRRATAELTVGQARPEPPRHPHREARRPAPGHTAAE